MRKIKWMAVGVCLCVCLAGCSERPAAKESASTPVPVSSVQAVVHEQLAVQPTEIVSRAVLLAVGDNLIHDVIYKQAIARTDGNSYDFKPIYERVSKQIAAADIAMINQETPLAKSFPPSSYPMFNTPVEMAADLRDVGFDVLNIANNHMLDKGTVGLSETIEQIRSTSGLVVTGAYDTPMSRDQTVVVEKNNITFAFLGFTQHTNGLVLPADKEYMAVYTDDTDEMRRQLEAARQRADVVVVSVHWGEENTHNPTDYQRETARRLAEYGADIIVGTHPHVLQPLEYVEGMDERRVPVIYSLGNFVSAQIESANLIGGMAEIAIEKNQTTGKITIELPHITPVVTHYGAGLRDSFVYPLDAYTQTLAASHGIRQSYGKKFSLDWITEVVDQVIDPQFLAKAKPSAPIKSSSEAAASSSSGDRLLHER